MAQRYPGKAAHLSDALDEEEADALKAALAYLLLENTDMDGELVYSLVFKNGSSIIWH